MTSPAHRHPCARRDRRTRAAGAIATGALAVAAVIGAAPATAAAVGDQGPPPEIQGGVTEQMLHDSVRAFAVDGHILRFAPDDHVVSLGDDTASEDGETTISLSTDLLFRENTWELPSNAAGRIASLVADVPDGASVQVVGHTDTQQPVGHDFDNQELSENRAEAVAQALRAERPDLGLDVSGRGDTAPAETGEPDEPAVHAANRRVEIVYAG
ncbi:OmpA family protein [Georgenia sp. MJ170]|uniref:OmpA family protein n=1 Tax=Georgenia sunbinii TaxID=3117728 RepID=UPI002F260111